MVLVVLIGVVMAAADVMVGITVVDGVTRVVMVYQQVRWLLLMPPKAQGSKGQIISECPYEIIVSPKRSMKKFPRFLP